MNKVYTIGGAVLLVIAVVIAYSLLPSSSKQTNTYSKPTAQAPASSNAESTTTSSGNDESRNVPDETGLSLYPKAPKEPAPDVSVDFNVTGSSENQKTITAKAGQRLSIKFTANFRDEVRIEAYDVITNIEPGRESTVAFTVDKSGTFAITLVKTKKTIGALTVTK